MELKKDAESHMLKLQTNLYSDNLKTSSDEVRKITPVDNNSCNETVSSDNSINLEPVVNDANKDFQTSTDWVLSVAHTHYTLCLICMGKYREHIRDIY